MCAVQHEPPRVPLTTHPNPCPAPGTETTSARHPGTGHPAAPTASPAFWGAAGHPQRISGCGEHPRHGHSGTGSCPCCQDAACLELAATGHWEALIPSRVPGHRPGHS